MSLDHKKSFHRTEYSDAYFKKVNLKLHFPLLISCKVSLLNAFNVWMCTLRILSISQFTMKGYKS